MTTGWKILAALLLMLAALTFGFVKGVEHEEVRRDLLDAKRENAYQAQVIAFAERVRKTTEQLQGDRDEQRRRDAVRIGTLARERDAVLASVRNRPNRADPAAHVPGVAGPGGAVFCTGAQLYRDDAEFLVRRSHIDDVVRSERDSCYASYQRAQETIKRFNEKAKD